MANSFELTGTLKVLEDLQTFASGFTKREFVIEVPDGKYPQMVKFETVRDKIDQLNTLSIGDELKVTFDVRGNEYKGRYYVNLNAWKIESSGGGNGGGGGGGAQGEAPSDPTPSSFDSSFDSEPDPSDDDIPF
jgi:single-strand DNA-binding protein